MLFLLNVFIETIFWFTDLLFIATENHMRLIWLYHIFQKTHQQSVIRYEDLDIFGFVKEENVNISAFDFIPLKSIHR